MVEAFFFVPVDGVNLAVDAEDVLVDLVDEVVESEGVEGAIFCAEVFERVEDCVFDVLEVLAVARSTEAYLGVSFFFGKWLEALPRLLCL